MISLNTPVPEKYFFRIIPFAFVWNHYAGTIGRALLALHQKPVFAPGDSFYTHAGNVKPRETLGEKLQHALKEAFGIEVYAVAGIRDDGVGKDRTGAAIPRVAVDVQLSFFSCTNRRTGDFFMSWVPPDEPLAPESVPFVMPEFEKNNAQLHELLRTLDTSVAPLDYSSASLERLEHVATPLNTKLTSVLLGPAIVYMGSMLVGYIFKHYSGKLHAAQYPWVRVQNSQGRCYILRPFVKAQKRLKRGADDSLVHYGELLQKIL